MDYYESILLTVKKLVGLDVDFPAFDADIITHINTVLFILSQMGVAKKFIVTGPDELWDDYLDGRDDLESIKTYIGAKVRQMFDPPTVGAVADALDRTIKELEWRLFSATDLVETKPEDIVPYEERHHHDRV